jgi:hypothetical protein
LPVTVWAEARLPGFHCWPEAPAHRSYLAVRHRHLFHVRADVAVMHDNRDVEFHDLRGWITAWWGEGDRECGTMSCEQVARELATYLDGLAVPVLSVAVSEDGEAGAVLTISYGGDDCTQ